MCFRHRAVTLHFYIWFAVCCVLLWFDDAIEFEYVPTGETIFKIKRNCLLRVKLHTLCIDCLIVVFDANVILLIVWKNKWLTQITIFVWTKYCIEMKEFINQKWLRLKHLLNIQSIPFILIHELISLAVTATSCGVEMMLQYDISCQIYHVWSPLEYNWPLPLEGGLHVSAQNVFDTDLLIRIFAFSKAFVQRWWPGLLVRLMVTRQGKYFQSVIMFCSETGQNPSCDSINAIKSVKWRSLSGFYGHIQCRESEWG